MVGRGVRTVVVRKVCQCLGQAISAVAIVMVGHVNTSPTPTPTPGPNMTVPLNMNMISIDGSDQSFDSDAASSSFGPYTAGITPGPAVPEASVTMAIVLLCISVGAAGFPLSGFNVNHLDIAPKYVGKHGCHACI